MVFSDTSTKLGLIQKIDKILFGSSTANTTEYPLADKTGDINQWYRTVMGWIFESAGTWSFDDSSYTKLPIARGNCVSGQNDYTFPTDYVDIEEIHYKDSGGIWHLVQPLDREEIRGASGTGSESGQIGRSIGGQASEEFYKTNGTPKYYDKFANSYFLYPAPDRTSTDGDSLRVYYTRDAAYSTDLTTSNAGGPFVSTDTTREPGFNRLWHPVLAYGAAYEYCIANGRAEKKADCLTEITIYKQMIQTHYARRKKDERQRISVRYQNNK